MSPFNMFDAACPVVSFADATDDETISSVSSDVSGHSLNAVGVSDGEASPPVAHDKFNRNALLMQCEPLLAGNGGTKFLLRRTSSRSLVNLHGNARFDLREVLMTGNGTAVGNRLVASASRCFQKKHASFKIFHGRVPLAAATDAERIAKLKSDSMCTQFSLTKGHPRGAGASASILCPHLASVSYNAVQSARDTVLGGPMTQIACTLESPGGESHALRAVPPKWQWDSEQKTYRANWASGKEPIVRSSKNMEFALDDGRIVMSVFKVAKDLFSIEFEYPLSGLQAFGIALTLFAGPVRRFAHPFSTEDFGSIFAERNGS